MVFLFFFIKKNSIIQWIYLKTLRNKAKHLKILEISRSIFSEYLHNNHIGNLEYRVLHWVFSLVILLPKEVYLSVATRLKNLRSKRLQAENMKRSRNFKKRWFGFHGKFSFNNFFILFIYILSSPARNLIIEKLKNLNPKIQNFHLQCMHGAVHKISYKIKFIK